jgi:methyltransferase of ATP-grasp peptide maturase system
VEAVPRHEFLRGGFFRFLDLPGNASWERIIPQLSEREWLEMAYTDESLVTQLNGEVTPASGSRRIAGNPTSSSTLPSLVVRMLEDLHVAGGMRVLEIGTGSGYSTGLLCHRLGPERVVSVEVDPSVATQARAGLARVGYAPAVIVGDGLAGHPAGAPYDRVIATCSVLRVPAAWIAQTRPGGMILSTVSGLMGGSGLARLTVTRDGVAEGEFLPGDVSFMLARSQTAPPDLVLHLPDVDAEQRPCRADPTILDDPTGRFVAQLAAQDARHMRMSIQDGPVADYLVDPPSDSCAVLTAQPDGSFTVRQSGPVALWDVIEDTLTAWQAAGAPGVHAFRIRVGPAGQTIWLGGDGRVSNTTA